MERYYIGLFIVALGLFIANVLVLKFLSKDLTDIRDFIISFLQDMIDIENAKLEAIERRNKEDGCN